MKIITHTQLILVALLFTFVFSGCQMDLFDNFDDYTPIVELTSIETNNDTIVLTGTITDDGHSITEYVGFCYNQTGNPGLEENQIVVNDAYGVGTFTAYVLNLKTDSTYYFRAFGANEYGYVLSTTKQYQILHSEPPAVPCTLTNNIIVDNGGTYPVSSVSIISSSDNYELRVSCYYSGGPTLYFYFKEEPSNGIYTTTSASSYNLGSNQVYVEDNTGLGVFVINDDKNVYVKNTGDSLIVSFCDLTYSNGNTVDLHGKFIKALN